LLSTLIRNWRTDWGQGDFPFGIVQIAPYRYHNSDNFAQLWEAQLLTAQHTPNTGLVVTTDIGNVGDIHPQNKQEVGRRLGLWALATVYGRKLVYSGPIYKSMTVEGDKIRLTFDHLGAGLASRDGKPLTDFTIAGADKKFHPATATIDFGPRGRHDGATVLVQSGEVPQPTAVRFAWREDAQPNLINKDGLPASPFGTDQE
jgi:sialate O-acetylesterase